jgi:hypothetical protein
MEDPNEDIGLKVFAPILLVAAVLIGFVLLFCDCS